jgi:hypothetical protein
MRFLRLMELIKCGDWGKSVSPQGPCSGPVIPKDGITHVQKCKAPLFNCVHEWSVDHSAIPISSMPRRARTVTHGTKKIAADG